MHWLLAEYLGCHRVFIFTTFGKFKIRHQELGQENIKDENKCITRKKPFNIGQLIKTCHRRIFSSFSYN